MHPEPVLAVVGADEAAEAGLGAAADAVRGEGSRKRLNLPARLPHALRRVDQLEARLQRVVRRAAAALTIVRLLLHDEEVVPVGVENVIRVGEFETTLRQRLPELDPLPDREVVDGRKDARRRAVDELHLVARRVRVRLLGGVWGDGDARHDRHRRAHRLHGRHRRAHHWCRRHLRRRLNVDRHAGAVASRDRDAHELTTNIYLELLARGKAVGDLDSVHG
mmetsp:Transcript_3621/g.12167  ORF Transcript_3621/g.12167 Transcript_3621/m.12167 type:complete len:221 (-) Transcript_3621:15-677(-)